MLRDRSFRRLAPVLITVVLIACSHSPDHDPNDDDSIRYYLFAPLDNTVTQLMDEAGLTVFEWECQLPPGNSVYLLESGQLLHTGNPGPGAINAGGAGGIVREFSPDGSIAWEFSYMNPTVRLHHDIERLPNGNILMIAWEKKTAAEAVAAGRNPDLLNAGELWADHIIEVDPASDEIVWSWHLWDHLVQDHDSDKLNFGVVGEHPELVDLNYTGGNLNGPADWTHINGIDYHEEWDQIIVSVHTFSELWIIDHSTSEAEASGHEGGTYGKGGDLLYRWGNPAAYRAGDEADQQLFKQHDTQWIEEGLPGEGNILVFNNGRGRPGGNWSSIEEILAPVDAGGFYNEPVSGEPFGPEAPVWTYSAENPQDFYSDHISGCQRLPDGNTLICDGPGGYFFEVRPDGQVVWDYQCPDGQVFRVNSLAASYSGLPDF